MPSTFRSRLVTFAESVWCDAGVSATQPQILEMAASAAAVVVNHQFREDAIENDNFEFLAFLQGLPNFEDEPPEVALEAYDDIHRTFILTAATKIKAEVGNDATSETAAQTKAAELAERAFTESLMALKPTWTDDIRKHKGPVPDTETSANAAGAPGGGGCLIAMLHLAVTASTVLALRRELGC